MGEPCSVVHDSQFLRGLNSETAGDRRHWPYNLLYAALLVGQAIVQIALVLLSH